MTIPYQSSSMAIQAQLWAGFRIVAATSLLLATGCEKPTVAEGSTATTGGVAFSLGDYQVRYLEVSQGGETYEYPQPALVIPITLENVGEGSFTYTPSHTTQQMTEAQAPLLYIAPTGENADNLPPSTKTLINGVFLEKGPLEGQITQNETIASGVSVTDLLLFEVPTSAADLILSIPPAWHRGEMPVLFRISYQPTEALGPKVHALGQSSDFGDITFTVTDAKVEFVKTTDTVQGEGFSSEPLYKISYELENNSSDAVSFDPSHRAVGVRTASLYGKGDTFSRVRFASSTTPEGQLAGRTSIPAGGKIADIVLFDRPPESTTDVSFEFPAALFGGRGIARYSWSYEYQNPPKPKELEKPEPKPAD